MAKAEKIDKKAYSVSEKSAKWGVFLSAACAVHCLALPLISVFTPAFGSFLSFSHSFEWMIFLLTIPFGFFMILRNNHWKEDSLLPFVFMLAGSAIFLTGFFLEETTGHYLFAIAGIFIATAQLLNLRVSMRAHDCETHG